MSYIVETDRRYSVKQFWYKPSEADIELDDHLNVTG